MVSKYDCQQINCEHYELIPYGSVCNKYYQFVNDVVKCPKITKSENVVCEINNKGNWCQILNTTCQEGYCSNCEAVARR